MVHGLGFRGFEALGNWDCQVSVGLIVFYFVYGKCWIVL